MGADRDEAIAIRWPATEVAATSPSHSRHRVLDAALDAGPFGFAEPTEERHHEIVGFAVGIDAAADLGHPEFDAVMPQQRCGEAVLTAGEGALGLTDDDRIEGPIWLSAVREEPRGLRPA